MDYGFEHAGKIVTPNGTAVSPDQNAERNRAMERAELARWAARPDVFEPAYYQFPRHDYAARPSAKGLVGPAAGPWFPYLPGAVVTTWSGTVIGRIVSATVYRHNFGSRMVAIRVAGTNGATYAGRASWDNGSVITLRRVKGK